MAKFKIKTSMISPLTEAGFIDGSGNIAITFVSQLQGEGQKFYKLTFSAASGIIETTNQRMIDSIEMMPPPAVKVNGTWIVGNPGTEKLFETATGTPTVDPAVSGTRQISVKDKNLVVRYANMSGDKPEPAGQDYDTLQPWVVKARNYFQARNL